MNPPPSRRVRLQDISLDHFLMSPPAIRFWPLHGNRTDDGCVRSTNELNPTTWHSGLSSSKHAHVGVHHTYRTKGLRVRAGSNLVSASDAGRSFSKTVSHSVGQKQPKEQDYSALYIGEETLPAHRGSKPSHPHLIFFFTN